MGHGRKAMAGASQSSSRHARGVGLSYDRSPRIRAFTPAALGGSRQGCLAPSGYGLNRAPGASSILSGADWFQSWEAHQGLAPRRTGSGRAPMPGSEGAEAGRPPRGSSRRPLATGGGGSGASQGRIASEVRTPNGCIKWGCYLSRRSTLEDAVDECIAQIRRAMRPGGSGGSGDGSWGPDRETQPEMAIVFVSAAFGPDFDRLVPLLRERLPSLKHVFGCSAFGVMGGGKSGTTEADGEPALSLTLGSLPGVDIRVFHTLRSSVPEQDAAVDRWAEFVGVPADTNRNVSFLMFSDPRFTQLYSILEGLDYSFPRATKLGGMLSVGVRSRQRAMFAWSAEQDVRTRVKPRAAAAAAAVAAAAAAASTAADTEAAAAAGDGSGGGGWLQRSLNYISKLTGQGGRGKLREGGGGFGAASGAAAAADDDSETTVMSNGMYLYGAVCLVLHGDVKLDAIVSQGFRAPSPMIWRVEATTAGMGSSSPAPAGHILTISDAREAPPPTLPGAPSSGSAAGTGGGITPGVLPSSPSSPSSSSSPQGLVSGPSNLSPSSSSSGATSGGGAAGGTASSSSSSAASGSSSSGSGSSFGAGLTSPRGFGGGGGMSSFLSSGGGGARGASGADDSDDSDDSDEDLDDDQMGSILSAMGISGTPSLAAIIDVVEALGSESAAWEEVMETCAVAVAADTTKALDELGPADWEIMELKGVDQEFGTIMVDGEVRRGYRIKIMVRDPPGLSEDLRAQLLAYKRDDLRRVLAGSPLPPSFGALVFTDVERTPTSSGNEVTESSLINTYLPLPTGGMFGGAQIAPLPGATELVEYSSVIGVLRAMNASPPEPLRSREEEDEEGTEGGGGANSDEDGGVRRRRAGPTGRGGGDGGSGGSGGSGGKEGSGRSGRGGGGRRSGGGGGGGSTRLHRGRNA